MERINTSNPQQIIIYTFSTFPEEGGFTFFLLNLLQCFAHFTNSLWNNRPGHITSTRFIKQVLIKPQLIDPRKEVLGAFPGAGADSPTGWQKSSSWVREHRCRGSAVLFVLGLVTRSLSGRVDSTVELVDDSLLLSACPGTVFPFQAHRLTGSLSGKLWRRPRPGKGRQTVHYAEGICSTSIFDSSSRKW